MKKQSVEEKKGKKLTGLFLPVEMMDEIDKRRREIGISRQAYITLIIYRALQEDDEKICSRIGRNSNETQTADAAVH